MGSIYIIKNTVNNKVYIGQTIQPVDVRFKEHLRKSEIIDTHLYKAMRKYGKDKFYYEILESNLEYSQLLQHEQYWISYYNSYKNGYNDTLGGEGYLKYTDHEILSLWQNGLNCSNIAKQLNTNTALISSRLQNLGITKEQIDQRVKEQNSKREYDPVLQFTKDGILIKEWPNATIIERETGMQRSNIKACCNGKLQTAYGYIWRRKNKEGPQRKAR